MVWQSGRLTALGVSRTKQPGMYPDGGGLYIQVSGAGARSWIYRYTLQGKTREMGLGSLNTVSLAKAREQATKYRGLRREGISFSYF